MKKVFKSTYNLDLHWPTNNPFLFCAHHLDKYPAGTPQLGVSQDALKDRNLGNDFAPKDGYRMYHGEQVPGFPVHPHRGFETVTVVLQGMIDHSDSHGAAGRYGAGDVQWMTAGSGLQHAEMFPLLHKNQPNPTELFQIWLNLPANKKLCTPHYKMLWAEDVPVWEETASNATTVRYRLVAGALHDRVAIQPAPDSWAANPTHHVRILEIEISAGGSFELEAVNATISRNLYFYQGNQIALASRETGENSQLKMNQGINLDGSSAFTVENTGSDVAFLLLLEGEPIIEPIVQYGPFVMNTQDEITKAFADYRQTQFGGWPWDRSDPVHGSDLKRFARYADGKTESR
ncbi:MAG: pirin family protein [Eubacteriales bacterium]|nr:pirin family protein [Eubacteriales bacterium]